MMSQGSLRHSFHISRRVTYNHLTSWLSDARNLTHPNTIIMLIGNKRDLESDRDVTVEEATKFAQENGLYFIESSAKTYFVNTSKNLLSSSGENVEEAFLKTARLIYQGVRDGKYV